jgi:hypothetical protein
MRNSHQQFRGLSEMSNRCRVIGQDLIVIAAFGCIGMGLFFSPWF